MITISMPVFGVSAALAVGIVAMDVAQFRPPELTPAETVALRFPKSYERLASVGPMVPVETLNLGKSDRLPPQGSCIHEHWPYIADECLVAQQPTQKPARTITVERRIGDDASQLLRVETTELAAAESGTTARP
jgi:hypothetical protein